MNESQEIIAPMTPEIGREFPLADPESVRHAFSRIWDALASKTKIDVNSREAVHQMKDMVLYDIPDGTRSTLTVPLEYDIQADAGLFCLALIHTLRCLGSSKCVIMTHTAYNRLRSPRELSRIFSVLEAGLEFVTAYAARNRVRVNVIGPTHDYELAPRFVEALPYIETPEFEAHFLVDYREDLLREESALRALETLPEIDVFVRHTKFQISGGWLPLKMRYASFVYCQNGSLLSNWTYDELCALAAVSLLSKIMHSGELLSKNYDSTEELKKRYKMRELCLFQRIIKVRKRPKKLFVLGSPIGLYQVYY